MTSCFSSVCGSVMPIFISNGACPQYLLAASAMSGPGSLATSKILVPETEQSFCIRTEDLEFEVRYANKQKKYCHFVLYLRLIVNIEYFRLVNDLDIKYIKN
jgi:nucleoside permease NupC